MEIWQITHYRVLYSSIYSNVQSVNETELPVNRLTINTALGHIKDMRIADHVEDVQIAVSDT